MYAKMVKSINMKNSDIKREITSCYTDFFKREEFKVNSTSGILENGILRKDKKVKFATRPYIGSQYEKNTKILFIGLEIGKDEYPSSIGSFEERQESIGNEDNYTNTTYNHHIAGTLITAVYFNKSEVWGKIKNVKGYKDGIRIINKNTENPLVYVALTNFYKFVTQGKELRSDPVDRQYISNESRKYEQELLCHEIEIFDPDIIIFQSLEFKKNKKNYEDFFKKLLEQLKDQNKEIEIWIGPHPAYRGSHKPKEYLSKFNKIK